MPSWLNSHSRQRPISGESDVTVQSGRRAPLLESVARWVLLVLFVIVGVGSLVWLGTHDPAYPTITSSRGDVFPLLAARQVVSPAGQWAEFEYLSPNDTEARDDSVAEELVGVLGPAAAQRGNTVLYVMAVRRKMHVGYLWNVQVKHAIRFEFQRGVWLRVQSGTLAG